MTWSLTAFFQFFWLNLGVLGSVLQACSVDPRLFFPLNFSNNTGDKVGSCSLVWPVFQVHAPQPFLSVQFSFLFFWSLGISYNLSNRIELLVLFSVWFRCSVTGGVPGYLIRQISRAGVLATLFSAYTTNLGPSLAGSLLPGTRVGDYFYTFFFPSYPYACPCLQHPFYSLNRYPSSESMVVAPALWLNNTLSLVSCQGQHWICGF